MRAPRMVLLGLVITLVASCGASGASADQQPTSSPSVAISTPSQPSTPAAAERRRPRLNTVAPAWLGTRILPRGPQGYAAARPTPPELRRRAFTARDTVAMLPGTGFASRVVTPAPDDVIARSSWSSACPIDRSQLAQIIVTFWGFDQQRHTGEMLVNRAWAERLVTVFAKLYAARFPLEGMGIATAADLNAPPTGDGNISGSFACRPARGQTSWSQHAYGLAVDINPFQNPYLKGRVVLPELATAYRHRGRRLPGMVGSRSVVVRAFASIGWSWGGSWRSSKDLMHFSANGR